MYQMPFLQTNPVQNLLLFLHQNQVLLPTSNVPTSRTKCYSYNLLPNAIPSTQTQFCTYCCSYIQTKFYSYNINQVLFLLLNQVLFLQLNQVLFLHLYPVLNLQCYSYYQTSCKFHHPNPVQNLLLFLHPNQVLIPTTKSKFYSYIFT